MRWRVAVPAAVGGAAVALAAALAVAPQAVLSVVPVSPRAMPPADRLPTALAAVVGVYAGWVVLSYRLSDASTPLQSTEADAEQPPADASPPADADTDTASPTAEAPESADEESSTTAQSITMGGKTLVRFGGGAETGAEEETETAAEEETEKAAEAETVVTSTDAVSDPESAAADPVADEQSRTVDTGERTGKPGGEEEPTAVGVPPERFDAFRRLPPEEPRERAAAVVGEAFDRTVAGQEARMGDAWPYEEAEVRERLAETLVAVEGGADRRPRAEAETGTDADAKAETGTDADAEAETGTDADAKAETRRAIERGTWTDDPVAAAFLSADESVSPPLRERLRAWLAPRQAFSRAVDRTVDAIERRADEGRRARDGGKR